MNQNKPMKNVKLIKFKFTAVHNTVALTYKERCTVHKNTVKTLWCTLTNLGK